jgi:hypothetical protein
MRGGAFLQEHRHPNATCVIFWHDRLHEHFSCRHRVVGVHELCQRFSFPPQALNMEVLVDSVGTRKMLLYDYPVLHFITSLTEV